MATTHAGATRSKRALAEGASANSQRRHAGAHLLAVGTLAWNDAFSLLLAIIIPAWETSSVSSTSEGRHQNLASPSPGKSRLQALRPCRSTGPSDGRAAPGPGRPGSKVPMPTPPGSAEQHSPAPRMPGRNHGNFREVSNRKFELWSCHVVSGWVGSCLLFRVTGSQHNTSMSPVGSVQGAAPGSGPPGPACHLSPTRSRVPGLSCSLRRPGVSVHHENRGVPPRSPASHRSPAPPTRESGRCRNWARRCPPTLQCGSFRIPSLAPRHRGQESTHICAAGARPSCPTRVPTPHAEPCTHTGGL